MENMEVRSHNTSIDWPLSIKLANNNKELAKELLEMFIADLPLASKSIRDSFEAKQYIECSNKVHRLHGAACYCGVPHLKIILAKMEEAGKEKAYVLLAEYMETFNNEVNNILTSYSMVDFV